MSEVLRFGTKMNNVQFLDRACERMRQAGMQETKLHTFADRCEVQLPSWNNRAVFDRDSEGRLTGVMSADNYSDYYDERKIDALTGDRIPGTGRVHPRVLSGEKRVGDDGRWGSISYLDRLQMEYSIAAAEPLIEQQMGRILSSELEADGHMSVMIELPG